MPLATCPRCNKMFDKTGPLVCPRCQDAEEEDYEKIRQSLAEHPNQSAEDLAEAAQVDIECVLRLLEAGRIETTAANRQVRCGRCGAPAISVSKKLCEKCLQELNAQIAMQTSKIRLPKRRSVDVGTAFNIPDSLDSKRATGAERRKNLMRRDDDS
ncbi:MAG: hypothetical protein JXR94_04075 [Candidatus Hydrogenedentes bacterium]|nr:hypothetical protein [Candidatus Hydrogenedentota bacterium]